MVKQWGLGESNQKELRQKGDEHKRRKAVTKSGAAGAAQQAERSAFLSESVK